MGTRGHLPWAGPAGGPAAAPVFGSLRCPTLNPISRDHRGWLCSCARLMRKRSSSAGAIGWLTVGSGTEAPALVGTWALRQVRGEMEPVWHSLKVTWQQRLQFLKGGSAVAGGRGSSPITLAGDALALATLMSHHRPHAAFTRALLVAAPFITEPALGGRMWPRKSHVTDSSFRSGSQQPATFWGRLPPPACLRMPASL